MKRILLCLSLASLAAACDCGGGGIDQLNPKIRAEPSPVSFDTVPLAVTAKQTLTIFNDGSSMLDISALRLGDGSHADFALELGSVTLPAKILPNESLDVIVSFTPTALGAASGSVLIASNDPDSPSLTVPIVATRRQGPVMVVCVASTDLPLATSCSDAPVLDFGKVAPNQAWLGEIIVRSEGTDPLQLTGFATAAGASPSFSVSTPDVPELLAPGEERRAKVSFQPTGEGQYTTLVDVASNDPVKGTARVTLKGVGGNNGLCVNPAIVDFGHTNIGSSSERMVAVSNCGTGNIDLLATELILPSGEISILNPVGAPITLAPVAGIAYQVALRYAPVDQGVDQARIRFRASSGQAIVPVTGRAATCDITFTPTPLVFTEFGGKTAVISNDGGQPCVVTELTVTSTSQREAFFAFAREPLPYTIEPGGSMTVDVAMNFPEMREARGTLHVHSNDPADPRLDVPLIATLGPLPACIVEVLPSSLEFGAVAVGTTRAMGVQVRGSSELGLCQIAGAELEAGTDNAFSMAQVGETPIVGALIIPVSFSPTGARASTGAMVVRTTTTGDGDIRVSLSGFGGSTGIRVDPRHVAFGDVATGTRTVHIYATGAQAVTINGLDWTTPDSEMELESPPALPFTIPAGGEQTIRVRYLRADAGGDTAVLTVRSDDPVQPALTVSVTAGPEVVPPEAGRFLYYWQIDTTGRSESAVMRAPLQGNLTPEMFRGIPRGDGCSGCHHLSSDGRYAAIVELGNISRTVIVDTETNLEFVPPSDLTDVQWMSWNPDVNTTPPYQFVYSKLGDLRVASLYTGDIGPLMGANSPDAEETMPSWGPDGEIVFVRNSSFGRRTMDPGEGDRAVPVPGNPANDIYIIAETGGTAEPLPGASENEVSNYFPAYSPNGNWVAITQSASGGVISAPDARLRLIAADRSGTVMSLDQLNDTAGASSYPTWSVNGQFISFASNRAGGSGGWDLYLAPIDQVAGTDGAPSPLRQYNTANFEHAVQWSP